MALFFYFFVALFGALGAWLYEPTVRLVNILGIRPFEDPANIHGIETLFVGDLVSCEDLEFHSPSGMLYTACSQDIELARGWNPGCGSLERPDRPSFGTIVVVDPKTLRTTKLSLEGFEGPFSTHGIALYTPPSKPDTVYVYAVNHVPNPNWTPESTTEHKAASRIELFVHTVGSDTAKHVRTIAHPLIRTPNDVLAISENEFLVTNDYFHREGPMLMLEQFGRGFISWTDLVHVRFDAESVDAAIALNSVAANNGLAWGPDNQVVIGNAHGGHIVFASLPNAENNRTMTVSHWIPTDTIVDNSNYFADPYAGLDGKDFSGYLLPGASNAGTFVKDFRDLKAAMPGRVAYLPAVAGKNTTIDGAKMRKVIFKDDGKTIRGVTTAVMVPIDPAVNGGKREGWLWVTSIAGTHMIATKIDFEAALV